MLKPSPSLWAWDAVLTPGRAVKEWRAQEPELGQGMLPAPFRNTQQQRCRTPFQLEGFAFSTSSCHILQHRTLKVGFMGSHVIHVAHDMPGNCTLQIFPQGPSVPWNWTTQSPVKKSCCFLKPSFVLCVELTASLLNRLILRLIVFGCYLLFLNKIMRSLL